MIVDRSCRCCGAVVDDDSVTCTLIVCRVIDDRISRVLAEREAAMDLDVRNFFVACLLQEGAHRAARQSKAP